LTEEVELTTLQVGQLFTNWVNLHWFNVRLLTTHSTLIINF